MSSKSRRRITMAVGATIAGAAIPIAAACNAWAETDYIDISYDGKTVYDDFPGANSAYGATDVGTAAESGTNGDYAEVYGPSTDNITGLANDSTTGDSGDTALYDGVGTTTAPVTSISALGGTEGASITNATDSDAEVYGGGNAVINPAAWGGQDAVSDSSAVSTNGGVAIVDNDGGTIPGITVTGDDAYATGTGSGTLADTPSVATVYDSGDSVATANDTGFNSTTLEGGAAVDFANGSDAYADNAGSAANIEGNNALAGGGTPVVDSYDAVGNGSVVDVTASNLFQIDGLSYTTFLSDLFGFGGAAAESTAFTDLLGLF
jgi:hypothetical protein